MHYSTYRGKLSEVLSLISMNQTQTVKSVPLPTEPNCTLKSLPGYLFIYVTLLFVCVPTCPPGRALELIVQCQTVSLESIHTDSTDYI